jgi:type I restriction enzyme R subunit
MAFNENTRVKIPALLHIVRLGYSYISLSNIKWDVETNIFTDIFFQSLKRINPTLEEDEVFRVYEDVRLALDNDDLGMVFYRMLTATSGVRLIDFKDFNNNTFNVVTELPYKNGDDEFRPDITLLINGLPLAFVEVKKPNNREGVLAERDRINVRFKNKKFKKFINISQLLVFSNNMEYDAESIVPIQGAFYATTSHQTVPFNCFREEESLNLNKLLSPEDESVENFVLKDNNLTAIKHSPEFITNKDVASPTNRILTSLFSKDRIAMLLEYGLAYVTNLETGSIEKHVMRYPQFFASRRIQDEIDKGVKKGIIWHTQGSGKTALAYYNVHLLTDYFSKKGVVPKFYFIVDRIDLMTQAKDEFESRGLEVHTVNSKEELQENFAMSRAIHGVSGKREITVVNIQKFEDETDVLRSADYDINIQRVYFLDEVHRSYNPTGSFLASLVNSDRNAIIIGLTGTPLIGEGHRSRDIFGDYIHKYYYNASIADGYTLKLIREGIETKYKLQLEQALKEVEILKGNVDRAVIYAHEKFVEPMLDYIIDDFEKSRIRLGDKTLGGMVVCDSADQAKKLHELFETKYSTGGSAEIKYSSALILHDVGDKKSRRDQVVAFKAGQIDLLFVYNMLLTGFDAKRLKKLYLGRVIRNHNLLQTLTRVNRPYMDHRYGYVVDFADIRKEFDTTNKAYFDELQEELGDEMKTYSNLFKSTEEIEVEIAEIKEVLFHFDLLNAEVFSQQITQIEDRQVVLTIKKALESAKNLYNIIRLYGHFELLDKLDFKKLNTLYNEASRHIELINLKESLQNNADSTNLLNVALENVLFVFRKISEDELVIADRLKDTLRKTREELNINFDQKDPEFTSLYEELKRLFDKKNLDEISQDEMKNNIGALQKIFDKVSELNRRNNLLKAKYKHDAKYARLHKRIIERGITKQESAIHHSLMSIKVQADEKVLINTNLLNNEQYFVQMMAPIVINGFEGVKIELDSDSTRYVNDYVVGEYLREYQGTSIW